VDENSTAVPTETESATTIDPEPTSSSEVIGLSSMTTRSATSSEDNASPTTQTIDDTTTNLIITLTQTQSDPAPTSPNSNGDNNNSEDEKEKGISTGELAGAIIGTVGVFATAVGVLAELKRRKSQAKSKAASEESRTSAGQA
jgi:hypothetical protein